MDRGVQCVDDISFSSLTVPVSARECRSLWQTSVSGRSSGGLRSWMRSPEKEHSSARVRNSVRERSSVTERSCRPESLPPLNRTRLEQRSETCTPVAVQGQPYFVHSPGLAHTAGCRSLWEDRSVVGRAGDHKLGKEDIHWQ